jgi:lysophospholipase L1-like esterase
VLCLGDSYTFGPYLPNHDTYPDLLGKINPDLEVINAGICGFTITDEVSLFIERSKYVAPDITILQVVANDITGLFWFMQNEFSRKHLHYEPRSIEKELMDEIVRSNKTNKVLR